MFAIDFEYDNQMLSDWGMMIMSFNGVSSDAVSSGADITFNQVRTASGDIFNLYSSTYDSAYSTTFQIGKNPCLCESQEEMYLSPIEVSALQRWLCQDEYCQFKIDQTEYENIYWNVTFSSKQIPLNGRIIALELTLYSDAPYAYLDEVEINMNMESGKTYTILSMSDEIGKIRPYMEIKFLESGNFILSNTIDSINTEIQNVSKNEVIILYGREQNIFSTSQAHIAKDFNYHYPVIGNTKQTNINEISSNLNCEITIKYSPIIKVGL